MTTNEITTMGRIAAVDARPRGAVPSQAIGGRLLATVGVLLVVAALTLAPRAIIAPVKGLFLRATDYFLAPVMSLIPYGEADRVFNTLLFIPLGAAVAILLSRRLWPLAILAGFAVSSAVEVFQTSIPGRVPDVDDVLWNTLGGAIGVMLVVVFRVIASGIGAGRRRARQLSNSTRT